MQTLFFFFLHVPGSPVLRCFFGCMKTEGKHFRCLLALCNNKGMQRDVQSGAAHSVTSLSGAYLFNAKKDPLFVSFPAHTHSLAQAQHNNTHSHAHCPPLPLTLPPHTPINTSVASLSVTLTHISVSPDILNSLPWYPSTHLPRICTHMHAHTCTHTYMHTYPCITLFSPPLPSHFLCLQKQQLLRVPPLSFPLLTETTAAQGPQ